MTRKDSGYVQSCEKPAHLYRYIVWLRSSVIHSQDHLPCDATRGLRSLFSSASSFFTIFWLIIKNNRCTEIDCVNSYGVSSKNRYSTRVFCRQSDSLSLSVFTKAFHYPYIGHKFTSFISNKTTVNSRKQASTWQCWQEPNSKYIRPNRHGVFIQSIVHTSVLIAIEHTGFEADYWLE